MLAGRARSLPDDPRAWPTRTTVLSLLILFVYAGIVLLRPGLPQNVAFIDPLIVAVATIGLISMTQIGSPATSAAARCLPWIWLIFLASFIGLSTIGIPIWAWSNLLRTVFALFLFFCTWQVLAVSGTERAAIRGTAIGLTVTSIALLVKGFSYRGSAFFNHPNYAGHFVTMAVFLLVAVSRRMVSKLLAVVALGIGVWQTASFGSIAMALAMLAVIVFRSLKRSTAFLTIALILLAIVWLFVARPGNDSLPSIEEWAPKDVLSEERLERSQGSRTEIWGLAIDAWIDEPWGVGPDGVKQREIAVYNGLALEVHADALGYLVERGPLGLIGFVGLWYAIWRSTKPGGLAHLLIVGALVQGLFRETMHYRHLWLLVALAAVIDLRRDEAAAPELDAPDAVPASTG